MKISGFTFMRNTARFYYPFIESIQSILPIVDEFVIALGNCDAGDQTETLLSGIPSDKIKVFHTVWDAEKFPDGTEYAHQTDLAKNLCSGDWLFYLQSDELLHEKYLQTVQNALYKYLDHSEIDGFLFRYKHFFGDYDHYIDYHGWYQHEVRIIRNKPDIRSWGDAQSFRKIKPENFVHYRQKEHTEKLNVVLLPAEIYHYGWVRPPQLMQSKSKAMDKMYHNPDRIDQIYQQRPDVFDYGNLSNLPVFKDSHPKVMDHFISKFSWKEQLHYERDYRPIREKMKHEKWKYKILTWIEKNLFEGKHLFTYKNYKIVSKE
ncbi:MAG: hypothetical protein IPM48_06270 [Saprospiraceae bacterium]|nr:hypothetical protein [Saprospiraceae bacterium]